MMWHFTGKGDAGETDLFDGNRVKKDDPVLEYIGAIDEINSFIGLARSYTTDTHLKNDLRFLQNSLSKLMGKIAGAEEQSLFDFDLGGLVDWLESKIRQYSRDIINPREFTYPGKTKDGAAFDICRTVARRAERIGVNLFSERNGFDNRILIVSNRLSSLFYMLRLYSDNRD